MDDGGGWSLGALRGGEQLSARESFLGKKVAHENGILMVSF